jgi:translation initiation factor 1A
MPNQQGGKNYKKSKHSTGDAVVKIQEAEADQMYGRVIKILGNLNMSVYCNDNYTRICKVCGAMRKRVWVNVGDLVIISLRDLGITPEKAKQIGNDTKEMRGDILHKFDQSLAGKIKKLDGINPKLFMQLEGIDGRVLGELGKKFNEENEGDEDGIIFDEEAPMVDEGGNEDDEEGPEKSDEVVPKAKKELKKAKESKIAKSTETEEVDIDNI